MERPLKYKDKTFDNYTITDDGIVYSLKYLGRDNKKALKLNKMKGGYLQCTVYDKQTGMSTGVLVHIAVYSTFRDDYDLSKVITHIDNDNANNNINNLKQVSVEEALGKRKCTRHCAHKIICIETGDVYETAAELAEALSVTQQSVHLVCAGKIKTLKGKHYKYLDD